LIDGSVEGLITLDERKLTSALSKSNRRHHCPRDSGVRQREGKPSPKDKIEIKKDGSVNVT